MQGLTAYLSELTPAQLGRIVARRPDSQLPPVPRTLAALADRLSAPHLIGVALLGLTRPELQVAEALAALGDGCQHKELAAALGVAAGDDCLTEILDRLAECALVWPEGQRLRTVPLDHVWPHPLDLGAPLVTVLTEQRAEDLRRIARELGVQPGTQKAVTVRNLADWLSSGDHVRRLCAAAPADTRELLHRLAWEGPYLDEVPYLYGRKVSGPAQWAVDRGLIAGAGHWGAPLQMPCEVALALRGADYRLPFEPVPPARPTVPVAGEAVEREAAAAAGNTLVRVGALLEECGRTPVGLLKAGGVGVRELRRLGKAIGDNPENVRLWLDLSVAVGLLVPTEGGLLPTEAYDDWCHRQPADQLVELFDGWLSSEGLPCYQPPSGASLPALVRIPDSPVLPILRSAVLSVVAAVPPDAAIADPDSVVSLISWRAPVTVDHVADSAGLIGGLWREAQLLGVVAHGAASRLGRALAAGRPQEVVAEAARLLPAAEETVLLQADLTAVVVGTPSGTLAALLDGAADREASGGAWTWRFSAASVRRAFDAGATGTELVAELRRVASGGRVPQPLEYLVTDAARRHGAIRVRPVACCLHSDDTALLGEILNARALARLDLTLLAPTVLASAAPVTETLAALRAAGYAPIGEHANGAVAVERTLRQRAGARADRPTSREAIPAATSIRSRRPRGEHADLVPADLVPADLLEDLLAADIDQIPEEYLLSMMSVGHFDEHPREVSEPEEFARRLLDRSSRHS